MNKKLLLFLVLGLYFKGCFPMITGQPQINPPPPIFTLPEEILLKILAYSCFDLNAISSDGESFRVLESYKRGFLKPKAILMLTCKHFRQLKEGLDKLCEVYANNYIPLTDQIPYNLSYNQQFQQFLLSQNDLILTDTIKLGLPQELIVNMVDMLIRCGASTEVSDENNETPLMLAAFCRYNNLFALLLSMFADVNFSPVLESNALTRAIDVGNIGAVKLLIANEVDIKSSYIERANDSDNAEITQLLLNAMSGIDEPRVIEEDDTADNDISDMEQ